MPLSKEESATVVKLALRSAGIAPDADELEDIIQGYPMLRASLDSLYEAQIQSGDLPRSKFSLEEFA